MKSFALFSAAALAVAMFGCQKSTTTAPAPSPPKAAQTDKPKEPELKKLTVMTAKDQSIERGESDKVLVTVNRDNFNDAVKISFNDLPAGIIAEQSTATIASGDNSVTLTLKANTDAALGEHMVQLVAEAPGMDKNVQLFTLKVKDKD